MIIEDKNFVLKSFSKKDINPNYIKWVNNKNLLKYSRNKKKIDYNSALDYLKSHDNKNNLFFKILKKKGNKVICQGNGGSAAIASHFSVDITKNAKIRSINFNPAIIDANAENLDFEVVIARIEKFNPRLICFVVYGQNVNAGTTNMSGVISLSNYIKSKKSSFFDSLLRSLFSFSLFIANFRFVFYFYDL